jgi:hypothetical protein
MWRTRTGTFDARCLVNEYRRKAVLTNEMKIGYEQALLDTFHPETGWFWDVLDEARAEMYKLHPDALFVIGNMNDIMVERVIREMEK